MLPFLQEKLQHGGALVFASAAACVLGRLALPVYEIYKAGEEPHWLPGLDLLAVVGLPAVILPHYNNTDGGNHDTRFCYMGERRLLELEAQLGPDDYILGLDEHTALNLDLDAQTATVSGKGAVTVRYRGRSQVFPSGSHLSLGQLRPGESHALPEVVVEATPTEEESHTIPLLEDVHRCGRDFQRSLGNRQGRAALACLLEIEQTLTDWSQDTDKLSMDQARALFRSLLVEFGEAAQDGMVDPLQRFGPFVQALLDLRRQAREKRDWAMADQVRDQLVVLGIEVHDTPGGTEWNLRAPAEASAQLA